MGGNRRRTLELVYSNDRPVRVVESGKPDNALEACDSTQEMQAIERFLSYLYEELLTLDKRQPAQLIGAAILALRDDVDGDDRSRG